VRRLSVLLAAPILAVMLVAAEPAAAPDRPLPDAAQEARARALFADVRCVVCQHESIADSPAGVAGDMRRLIREEIAAGADDAAVRADLVRRFGDYVLFRPPVRPGTWLLWFGPFALVLLAGAVLLARRRAASAEPAPLSADEQRRLDDLLQNENLRRDPDATSPHDGR
jgi:cytochrome c-type biogenesis protein CcmH